GTESCFQLAVERALRSAIKVATDEIGDLAILRFIDVSDELADLRLPDFGWTALLEMNVPDIEDLPVWQAQGYFEGPFSYQFVGEGRVRKRVKGPANNREPTEGHQSVLLEEDMLAGSSRDRPCAIARGGFAGFGRPSFLQQNDVGVQPPQLVGDLRVTPGPCAGQPGRQSPDVIGQQV